MLIIPAGHVNTSVGAVLSRTVETTANDDEDDDDDDDDNASGNDASAGGETRRAVDADAQHSEKRNDGDDGDDGSDAAAAAEAVDVPLLEFDVDRQVTDAGSAQF